jgi:hypothetical protein
MNIYKVTRKIKSDSYDEYLSFVCFAENEEQAVNLNPDKYMSNTENFSFIKCNDLFINWDKIENDKFFDWVNSPNELEVIKLGVSECNHEQPSIIIVCYNLG